MKKQPTPTKTEVIVVRHLRLIVTHASDGKPFTPAEKTCYRQWFDIGLNRAVYGQEGIGTTKGCGCRGRTRLICNEGLMDGYGAGQKLVAKWEYSYTGPTQVEYPKSGCSFLGRNGCFKQHGLSAMRMGDEICIEPTTSRGDIGRAQLCFPIAKLDAVIAALRAAAVSK